MECRCAGRDAGKWKGRSGPCVRAGIEPEQRAEDLAATAHGRFAGLSQVPEVRVVEQFVVCELGAGSETDVV